MQENHLLDKLFTTQFLKTKQFLHIGNSTRGLEGTNTSLKIEKILSVTPHTSYTTFMLRPLYVTTRITCVLTVGYGKLCHRLNLAVKDTKCQIYNGSTLLVASLTPKVILF